LKDVKAISLTDGGVLENLGIQTLLKSSRFSTWDIVVSDAGTKEETWRARPLVNALRGFGVWLGGGETLDRVMLIMNAKQNRWARQQIIEEVQRSWLIQSVLEGDSSPAVDSLLTGEPKRPPRQVLFVRVNQTWRRFMEGISPHRLAELGATSAQINSLLDRSPSRVPVLQRMEGFLEEVGVDLEGAREYYQKLGGDGGAKEANEVSTNFTGLPSRIMDILEFQAAWQVFASHAIYGFGTES
jgi:hypothetical protein